ncbi:hypothetical protein EDB81DRAFT_836346 [Dactylonectria macrodidyma]|uniref:Azaphilone pigments biosynthesis cluster protein L N-terminal domain-containing protein n=1 Tax=Dactylonectria macrodidyma TaxID=307937 RepID=A0A9P9JNL8_9HYPO|nr:hypothetical protein EDB81DRAFT_836346 [Dactylonectria macrodidyma]
MDPVSVTTSVLAVGGFALTASTTLHNIIRSYQSQNKDARALKAEVNDLTVVLGLLLETIANNPTLDFKGLELPLQRCGTVCEDYAKVIARCTKHSDGSRPSARDWITQKYLQGDINDFRTMLTTYKSTINIALANANLCVAAISPEVLENYKDMISDTTSDLDTHLRDVQEKIARLQSGDVTAVDDIAVECHAMLEEKKSTQRGLDMCARLSAQIAQFESASTEHARFSDRPSAHKHVKSGLGEARGSVQSLISRLQTHEALIDKQLEAVSSKEVGSETVATQLARLQQTKESIGRCIEIVSEANDTADERSNVFEDITLADNSYAFTVSTVNDLVTARGVNLKGRSRYLGGQVTDETVQQSIAALTKLDAENLRSLQQNPQDRDQGLSNTDARKPSKAQSDTKQFNDRFGPGTSLSLRRTS